MDRNRLYPALLALAAALLFGASAPLAKVLLGQVQPIPLAALLYLGCGAALLILHLFQRLTGRTQHSEAPLRGKDYGWLAGSILAGGVLAPIILLFSLQTTPAATASLLLNFETVATTLIAGLAFKEAISGRTRLAIGLITLAGILLTIEPQGGWGFSLGALGIMVACALWGLDNNFTRNISAKDPRTITMIKGLGAGGFSVGLAFIWGDQFPPLGSVVGAMILGAFSYGLSIVLFIQAMRGLGAARTSALFGTAPLAGVALSFLIFRGSPAWTFLAAFPLMLVGTIVLIREQHGHFHVHEELVHEHAHSHDDEHHAHRHKGPVPRQHSHEHSHAKLEHQHEHAPDLHHRHAH
jgi:drug/metabolite transporter (DMT)-like permease